MNSFRVALVLLCGAMAGCALAAPESAAAAVLDGNQRLAEIRSRGEALSGNIAAAQDEFFRLFNAVNINDQFDVQCGPMALDAGMEMSRKCEPRYIAGWSIRRKGFEIPDAISMGGDPSAVFPSAGLIFGGSYVRLTAGSPSLYKGEDNSANFRQVVFSEPRLQEQIEIINELYSQMRLLQGRYAQAKREILAARISMLVKTNVGPRRVF